MSNETPKLTGSANGATVVYRGWLPSSNGGGETIELSLPLGASPEALQQAIQQWHEMREGARAALRQVQEPAPAPADVVLNFGKHRGKALGLVVRIDPDYVLWLSDEARSSDIKEAARAVLRDRAHDIAPASGLGTAGLGAPMPASDEQPDPLM